VPAPIATPAPAASHEPAAAETAEPNAPTPAAPTPAPVPTPAVAAPAAAVPAHETPAEPAPVAEATPVAELPLAEPAELPVLALAKGPVESPQPPKRREGIHVEAVLAQPAPAPVQPVPVPVPAVQEVTDPKRTAIPSIERALSGPSRTRGSSGSWGGKVKIVTGNGATPGPGARDQEAQDRNRARLPIAEPRRILILGCTSGAGQSVT